MSENNRNTDDLLKQLRSGPLDLFLEEEVPAPSFCDYIAQLCLERNETRAHVIKRAGIDRTYGHQIFNGTRVPSRDKVIQLAFGFALNLDQTQSLLKAARQRRLTPQERRDAAILYGILHGLDLKQTQELLQCYQMLALGA